MKGHLRIGRELYAQGGDTANGLAHFVHPRSELYDALAPALRERGAPAFEAELGALAEVASQKADWQQVQPVHDRLIDRIDAAIARVDAAERVAPAFVVTVAMALLQRAAREYNEAVKGAASSSTLPNVKTAAASC